MTVRRFFGCTSGTAAIEMAFTLPAFLVLLIGAVEFGLACWTQFGIEHGVEMAARCAVVTPTTCNTTAAIQSYAAAEAFGLRPPASTFTVTTPTCGEQVNASYTFNFLTKYFNRSVTLTAMSCFPK